MQQRAQSTHTPNRRSGAVSECRSGPSVPPIRVRSFERAVGTREDRYVHVPEPGQPLPIYVGPALVNGRADTLDLWLPLWFGDTRIRWSSTAGVEDLAEATIEFDHPEFGSCSVQGAVYDTAGFGSVSSTVIGDSTASVASVELGWTNLPWLGAYTRIDEYPTVIEAAGWRLGISPVEPLIDRKRDVRCAGIPVYLSHESQLSRIDDGLFAPDEALDALHAFQLGLSFALGRFVAPVTPTGRVDGRARWMLTPAWRCDQGLADEGIVFPLIGADLAAVVGGVTHELLGSDRDHLRYLVMHAVTAHGGAGVESRLTTAQSGLEYYSYSYLVGGGHLSRNKASAMPASDRIELALDHAQIPKSIPEELEALVEQAADPAEDNVPDTGPGAAAWVRNRISHPKDPLKPYAIDGLVFHASLLMREYLELLILHHIGYQSDWRRMYPPGHWDYEREPVPWST